MNKIIIRPTRSAGYLKKCFSVLKEFFRRVLPITKKELYSYFVSPVAYIVITVFLVISGYFFTMILLYGQQAELRGVIHNMSITLLFVGPIITMKLLAEEKKIGTIELLTTSPVSLTHIIIGKYLASLVLLLIITCITFEYPLFLLLYGKPDIGPMISAYLGFILLGSAFLSVGLFASSLTENQIVATVVGFGMLLMLWIIGWLGGFVGGWLGRVISSLSIFEHFDSFTRGVIDMADILYYISISFSFIFLTIRRSGYPR